MPLRRSLLVAVALLPGVWTPARAQAPVSRPFGTLREQAERQQRWLRVRMDSVLPALMRREGVDMWVVPMREYNEDPVFRALVSPTTFAARRRTIYVFHDRGVVDGVDRGVARLALGGTSQGGVYEVVRPTARAAGGAELRGDEQWRLLRGVVERHRPRAIAIDVSRDFALADGLTKAEHDAMAEALGPAWAARLRPAGALAVDLLASRGADESRFYADLARLTWDLVDTMFSRAVITPGATRTSDAVWWFRQRVADLGLAAWFQPSLTVQRRGAAAAALGDDPVILPGDVLHCDVGIAALGLHTDVQHMAYVPRGGETTAPAGLVRALAASSRLQEIVVAELRPGRTGNEVLRAARARMRAEGIDGTVYSHPIGLHGHGAGAPVGLWDRQEGVPGSGDHRIIRGMWYSIELQATSAVPEWGGQRVRSGQEEDLVLDADGTARWAWRRQTEWRIVR